MEMVVLPLLPTTSLCSILKKGKVKLKPMNRSFCSAINDRFGELSVSDDEMILWNELKNICI